MFNSTDGLTKLWTVDRNAKRVGLIMFIALVMGCVIVWFGSNKEWAGLLWAGACSAVGWFLGFLFGIPRSLSSDTSRTALKVQARSSKGEDNDAAAKAAAILNAVTKAEAAKSAKKAAEEAAIAKGTAVQEADTKVEAAKKAAEEAELEKKRQTRVQESRRAVKAPTLPRKGRNLRDCLPR
jgi:hypothetical protein